MSGRADELMPCLAEIPAGSTNPRHEAARPKSADIRDREDPGQRQCHSVQRGACAAYYYSRLRHHSTDRLRAIISVHAVRSHARGGHHRGLTGKGGEHLLLHSVSISFTSCCQKPSSRPRVWPSGEAPDINMVQEQALLS